MPRAVTSTVSGEPGGSGVSWRRRVLAVVSLLAALVLVVSPLTTVPASVWIAAAGLLLLTYSFFVDTRWLWRHARAAG